MKNEVEKFNEMCSLESNGIVAVPVLMYNEEWRLGKYVMKDAIIMCKGQKNAFVFVEEYPSTRDALKECMKKLREKCPNE